MKVSFCAYYDDEPYQWDEEYLTFEECVLGVRKRLESYVSCGMSELYFYIEAEETARLRKELFGDD